MVAPASSPSSTGLDVHEVFFQPHLLVHALERDLDRPFIFSADGAVLTARAFYELTSQYCQALQAFGLTEGARVGLLSGNRLEVLVLTAACLVQKYVLVPLHPLGSLDDHLYIARDAAIHALVFDPLRFTGRASQIQASMSELGHCFSFGVSAIGTDLSSDASHYNPGRLRPPRIRGDEPYRMSYTGGTTGKPKAILGTYRTGLAVLAIQMSEWEWPARVRQLVCAPLSHAAASVFLPTLLRDGSIYVLPEFDAVQVLKAIQTFRITSVLLVPTMIYALLDCPSFSDFDLSSLETVFYGASAMSPTRLREAIERLGPIFFQFYGQAEAPMTIAVLRRDEHDISDLNRLSSCGRPVPWVDMALMDDQMREVPIGEPGEICVRGHLVMQGYHNRPEQTAEAFAGGWLHTGDVAIKDPKGFLRIVDRKKDMIITGGFNVYPREIEDVLGTHSAVSACAVIGVPNARWGEAVTAIVVLRPGAAECSEELIALVRHKKGAVQAPKTVIYVDAIPLTALGKPDKKVLRARFADTPPVEAVHG
jgi:fatty-acyl-CoA synthase